MRIFPGPLLIASFALAAPAGAAELVTPPSMYPSDTWQGKAEAVVRVLDKLDAHTETLTIGAGKSGTYKSLTITAQNCLVHPPGLPADAAASIGVQDRHPDTRPFSGWLFAAEPYVNIFESPVYGVWLVACSGADVAPAAPPLVAAAAPVAPAGPDAGTSQPGIPSIQAEPTPPPVGVPGGVDQAPDPVYPTGQPDASAPATPPDPQN